MDDSQKVSTSDLERLVVASRTGDRGAFDQLVRLYQRRAMQAAVRILGDANDAAEAVQAGFVRAYLKIGKLRQPRRFEVWLLRIITNAAISQRRPARRRTQKTDLDCYEDSKSLSPLQKGIAEELSQALQQAMSKLSKKEAKAIALFGLKDLSHREAHKC